MNTKKEAEQIPVIMDAEIEAAEFESILKDVGKSIEQSCTRLGKSGLTFEEFKANFLKKKKEAMPSQFNTLY